MRLLPRSEEDIEVAGDGETLSMEFSAPSKKPPLAGIGLIGATTTAVGARAWWWRKKKQS